MRGSDDVDSEVVHHDLEHLPAAAVRLCDGVVIAANVAAVELLRPDDRGAATTDEETVVGHRLDTLLVPLDDGVDLARPAVPPARARGPRHSVVEVRVGIGEDPPATHLALLLDVTAEDESAIRSPRARERAPEVKTAAPSPRRPAVMASAAWEVFK